MGSGLSVDIVGPGELTAAEIALWTAFVRADPRLASPYFHPRFTQAAGEIAPGAAVAVLHDGGRIAGFFPHQRRGGTVQPIAAPLNDYHGVILSPDARAPIAELPELLDAGSLAVNGWVGDGPDRGLAARQTLQADLSHGWDAWESGRRAVHNRFFRDKDRSRRALGRLYGGYQVRLRSAEPDDLDRLVGLKREQYRRSRRHDIFACGWTVELLRALLAETAPDFGGRLAVLEAGGWPIAFEYGLTAGDRYHFWLPAYETHASRYSPGMLLSLETLRLASREGFTVFDFGFAGEPYKKYFCDRAETVLEGTVLRAGLSDAVGAVLDLAGLAPALQAGAALAQQGLGLSVRRRWAAIDACETTAMGRARGVASAASAALAGRRAPRTAAAMLLMLAL